jgi:hypothetical protein
MARLQLRVDRVVGIYRTKRIRNYVYICMLLSYVLRYGPAVHLTNSNCALTGVL